jgi:hypothetical protein
MSRTHETFREPEQTDRFWQAYARRKAIEDAEWQYHDELQKQSEGFQALEAAKGELNRSYVNFSATQNYPTP